MLGLESVTVNEPDAAQDAPHMMRGLRRSMRPPQGSKDAELTTVVLRKGLETVLKLRPAVWAGQGLLGCHIKPL